MAMLDYNEITKRKFIVYEEEPYEVMEHWVFRKQKRKPVNQTKLRNLISGRTIEITFHATERAEEADLERKPIKFLYKSNTENWFCDPKNPADRYKLDEAMVGDILKWTKPNQELDALLFNDEIIGVRGPIKVVLQVKESAPAVKGDTSGNALKTAIVETGTRVMVPMFINEGDLIEINTDTGDYSARAEKA
jgi:elongation factor P